MPVLRQTFCRFCGMALVGLPSEPANSPHVLGECLKEPMLSAHAKHGARNHAGDITRFAQWIDRNYHFVMLAEMTIELVLILILVALAWRSA